jgi:hypothetical protein
MTLSFELRRPLQRVNVMTFDRQGGDHMSTAPGTPAGEEINSPGTGSGPSESASPRSIREDGTDPSNVNDRNSGYGGKEDLLRDFRRGS